MLHHQDKADDKPLPDDMFREICAEYLLSLHIPHTKPAKAFMLCPVGFLGSGKTTVTTALCLKLSLVRISNDEVRRILKEKSYNWDRVREITLYLAKNILHQDYSIALDTNCGSSDEKVEQVEEIAKEHGIRIIWIHINPPESFILSRLKETQKDWLWRNSEQAVKNYLAAKKVCEAFLKNASLVFTYTFDTSRPDVEEQIEKAVHVIKKAVAEEEPST